MLKNLSELQSAASSFWQKSRKSPKLLPLVIILATLLLMIIFKLVQPEPPVKSQAEKTWAVQTHRLVAGEKSPQLELYGQVESP